MNSPKVLFVVILYFSSCLCYVPDLSCCEVAAKTEQGYVCGAKKKATNGAVYASFKGIPYAKQPLGNLRFKELQPAEPFDGIFNATEEGPICAQVDIFYKPKGLAKPTISGEDCIRINIYVPDPERNLPNIKDNCNTKPLLPILFWIHGGGFSFGSGHSDVHGPEYLMTKDCILITINYRLHAFGFLSLNNKYIPGNNGLRDCITALKWVQRNIKNFGGDPDRVTIGGQSAGGVIVHLLSISPATKGLFKQVVALSGNSFAGFCTTSPAYSKQVSDLFFSAIGINPLQGPKETHDDLVATPLETILYGNKVLLDTFGIVSFTPVIETEEHEFTVVLPKDPEVLIKEGAGKEHPIIIGFCSDEMADFKQRLIDVDLVDKVKLAPTFSLPMSLLYASNPVRVPVMTEMHLAEYYNLTLITLDKIIVAGADLNFKYPAQRLTQRRSAVGAAKTYLYQFGYPGLRSPMKLTEPSEYTGAAHVEDITYFFRFNVFCGSQTEENELEHTNDDNRMKDWMTTLITNFIITGSPVEIESQWPPSDGELKFLNIESPFIYNFTKPTPYMEDKLKYFTELYKIGLGE